MEDNYEGEHYATAREVRREGYWSVLSGCTLGRIFGNVAIWNFNWPSQPSPSWKDELGSDGSVGQAWLGKLFRSREHWKLVPDIEHTAMTGGSSSSLLMSAKAFLGPLLGRQPHAEETLSVAARTADGQTIIAYVPNGNAATITIAMDRIADATRRAKCWWFNPRDGSSRLIGTFPATGSRKFNPPDREDWVLVVDSLGAGLAAPGTADL
jgi:hypothetical protein